MSLHRALNFVTHGFTMLNKIFELYNGLFAIALSFEQSPIIEIGIGIFWFESDGFNKRFSGLFKTILFGVNHPHIIKTLRTTGIFFNSELIVFKGFIHIILLTINHPQII